MLKTELVKIKLTKRVSVNNHYLKMGYFIENKVDIIVNTTDLHIGSGAIVTIICDNCKKELKMEYKVYYKSTIRNNSLLYYCEECKYCRIKETNIEKYGVENVMQLKEISNKMIKTQKIHYNKNERTLLKNKTIIKKYGSLKNYNKLILEQKKKTCLEKYGVENVMLVDEIKKKGQSTCLEKYGKYNIMFIDKYIKKSTNKSVETKIKRNLIIPEDKLNDFEKYRRIIRRLVYKFKKELYDNWSGYDYYDNEYIIDNLKIYHTDNKYPSIDHKISVYEGFNNNIDPYIIGDIQNLCITKRGINSSKCNKSKPDQDYLNKIKNKK